MPTYQRDNLGAGTAAKKEKRTVLRRNYNEGGNKARKASYNGIGIVR